MALFANKPLFTFDNIEYTSLNINHDLKTQATIGTNIVNNYEVSSLEKTASTELDSAVSNSITNLYINNDILFVDVRIKDKNSKIRLSIYNMLAKEVLLISDDIQPSEYFTYQKNINELPNGAYICVLVGNNFRDAEKFLISR